MTTAEIIKEIKTLPNDVRKVVLRLSFKEAEEEFDTLLFDERSGEPDGRSLEELVARCHQ